MNFQIVQAKRIRLTGYQTLIKKLIGKIHRMIFRLIPIVSTRNVSAQSRQYSYFYEYCRLGKL